MKEVSKFVLILLLSLSIAFLIHLTLLHFNELPLFEHKIIAAYVVNFILALVIYLILFYSKEKYSAQLGFIYMGGSFIKFIVFFLVFYPYYKSDGKMEMLEFAAFFTPYAICLIIETLGVIKILNKEK